MKKQLKYILLFTMSILLVCVLSSCFFTTPSVDSSESGGDTPAHTHTFGEWQYDNGRHAKLCSECNEQYDVEDHTITTLEGHDATCGASGLTDGTHCTVCEAVFEPQEIIQPTDIHTPTVCGIVKPTFTSDGCTSGQQCSVCDKVLSGSGIMPAFNKTCDDYAYAALASKPNGDGMQRFYRLVYTMSAEFHDDPDRDAVLEDEKCTAFSAPYSAYGITSDDAFTVWEALTTDCPLFYWIDRTASASSTHLNVRCEAAYADGEIRCNYNQQIYDGISEIKAPNATAYEKILYLHDLIIERMNYAYRDDGVTPETEEWAHDITGFFIRDSGVCETYATTYQLFLNYWGIENILAAGVADNEPHAWNLVRLGSSWYWVDVTWDDQPSDATGRTHDYFCKTDNGFELSERTLDTELYTLPARGSSSYQPSVPAVGTSFTYQNYTCRIMGYREVELTEVIRIGVCDIPSTVSYSGTAYTVTSVGKLENNTLYCVFTANTTEVSIPATVKYIRAGAFANGYIYSVTVSSSNPYLISTGTTIYKKSPCVLIYHLEQAKATSLTLRSDTVGIASFALADTRLQSITIPSTVTFIKRNAFLRCDSLRTITFAGTQAQWAKVNKEGIPSGVTVNCTK